MKRFLIFYFFLFFLKGFGQNCDSTITIFRNGGKEVDSIRNGFLVSRSYNGTVFEQNFYDSLQRLTNRIYYSDSIIISYDSSSRIIMKEFFRWQGGGWQFKSDTTRVNYYYTAQRLDSVLMFQWDSLTFNPFHRLRYFYNSNDTLIAWQTNVLDSGQWVIDSLAIINYSLNFYGFTRVDSVFSDSIDAQGHYLIISYDSLERIRSEVEMYSIMAGNFTDITYECGQISSIVKSCAGCRSAYGSDFYFNSLCQITLNVYGHYSISGPNNIYKDYYYYAGCSTLIARAYGDVTICKGDSVYISSVAFGGTAPWHSQWSPSQGLSNDTLASLYASPDTTTSYIVTITDSSGLTASDTVKITVVNPPVANLFIESIDTISMCQSAVLAADSISGYNISWQRDSLYFGYNAHKNIVYNGTYIISVESGSPNSGVCPIAYDTLYFNYFSHPAPYVTLSRGCGEVYANRSDLNSGIEWFFNGQSIPDSTRDTLIVNQNGTYGAMITDSSGCSSPSLAWVNYQIIQASTLNRSTCVDSCNGILTIQSGANYQYSWSNGATTNQAENLCNGIYSVLITDVYGCTLSLSDTVGDFPEGAIFYLSSGTSSAVACDGFVFAVDSANIPYHASYTWEDSSHGTFLDSVCSGWHTVLTTPNFSLCPQLDSFFVAPSVSTDTCSLLSTLKNPTCVGMFNGTITVSSSTGSPFACYWYSGNTSNNQLTFKQNLGAGTYSCMIIDQNGCIDSVDITLVGPIPISVSLTSIQNACQDSCLLSVQAAGGSPPYRYTWCNGQTGSPILYCGENCLVYVRDTNNCLIIDTLSQNQVFPLQLSIITLPTSCPTCNDGTMFLRASGGTPPYLYSIDGGPAALSDTVTGLNGGFHAACVIGADSCSTCTTSQILLNTNSITQARTVQIYPNPFYDQLNVHYEEYKTGTKTNFLLVDLFGRVVVDLPVLKTKFEINGKGLNSGMYIYELKTEGLIRETGRLILSK